MCPLPLGSYPLHITFPHTFSYCLWMPACACTHLPCARSGTCCALLPALPSHIPSPMHAWPCCLSCPSPCLPACHPHTVTLPLHTLPVFEVEGDFPFLPACLPTYPSFFIFLLFFTYSTWEFYALPVCHLPGRVGAAFPHCLMPTYALYLPIVLQFTIPMPTLCLHLGGGSGGLGGSGPVAACLHILFHYTVLTTCHYVSRMTGFGIATTPGFYTHLLLPPSHCTPCCVFFYLSAAYITIPFLPWVLTFLYLQRSFPPISHALLPHYCLQPFLPPSFLHTYDLIPH